MLLRKLLLLAITSTGLVLAADPIIGAWKMNVEKSKFSPGPPPKSVTITYTEEGDWIVSKSEIIDPTGKPLTRNNRYRLDGKAYPFEGPNGKGTISVQKTGEREATSTINFGAGKTITQQTVISADGKTRTVTTSGTNAAGEKVDSTVVWDRQ